MRKKFLLRISPDLWDELNRWAADDFRSVNAQIEFLLQQSVRRRRRETDDKESRASPNGSSEEEQ